MLVRELENEIKTDDKNSIVVKFNKIIEEYPCYFTDGMIAEIDGIYEKAEGVFLDFDDRKFKNINQSLKQNDTRRVQYNNWFHFCIGRYEDEIDCFEILH